MLISTGIELCMKQVVLEEGDMVAKRFALPPHSKKGVAFISVWRFYVLHLPGWVLSRSLVQQGLCGGIGNSNVESKCVRASGCVSFQ